MSKPIIARVFQRKKGGAKALDKARGSRKERELREETRLHGVDGLDLKRMGADKGDAPLTMADLDADDEAETAGVAATTGGVRARLFGKGKESPVAVRDAREVREDYSQYSKDVAEVMRGQDEDLDHISAAVADMKLLAGAMTNELEYQDKLIHEVQDFTTETSRRTKANARKVNRIK